MISSVFLQGSIAREDFELYFTAYVTPKDVTEDVEEKVRPIRTLFMHVMLSNALIYRHVRPRGRTTACPDVWSS